MKTTIDARPTDEMLWQQLLTDHNQDGLVDGITACFVPLMPDGSPAFWAALANLAARLGLESPAIHLPLVCAEDAIQPWQCPLFFSWDDGKQEPTQWATVAEQLPLVDEPALRVVQVMRAQQIGFWIQGNDAAAVIEWLTQLATTTTEDAGRVSKSQGTTQSLDLAKLYRGNEYGFFTANHDGFMPDDTAVQLVLGPACNTEMGAAAVNLAARLGVETTGITFPLATATDELPEADTTKHQIALGFPETPTAQFVSQSGALVHRLDGAMCRYLADVYPFLNSAAQCAGDEAQTVQHILDHLRAITHAHTPLAKLALAEVQAGHSLHLIAPGAHAAEQLQRVVFRQEWSPADGLDERQRVYKTFIDKALPYLQQQPHGESPLTVTLFCNAPAPARQRLAAVCREQLGNIETAVQLQILPVHKAGLTWLLEEQLPQLQEHEVAQVTIAFAEFRPPSVTDQWLDLPTRWLQELFPADELLAQRLGLALEQVTVEMLSPADGTTADLAAPPTYRIEARNADGQVVHTDELHLLWNERLYMAGLPQFGLVHPTTGGIIIQTKEGTRQAWPTPTDDALFWDFYQDSVLPALRSHV
ncbi:MAG: hypothetical protein KDE19_25365, partial [Caldilineaceae bacterium]|nr:hypothetical protein [Caldilineaceae bacterium]